MSKTGIPYLDEVLNVTSGCTKISEGCAHCYAERINLRFGHTPAYDVNCPIVPHPERLEEALRWRRPRRAGVCFTSDLFHDQVPDEFIDKVFAVMALTPQHTYMLLTKRPERMKQYIDKDDGRYGPMGVRVALDRLKTGGLEEYIYRHGGFRWPLASVWLGVSCENQARADERIPLLLDTPAAHRWVSLEPLLGKIDLSLYVHDAASERMTAAGMGEQCPGCATGALDWCVIGGESGPHARPCDLGWIRDIRDQCKAAGVPCYIKQVGAKPMLPISSIGHREWMEGQRDLGWRLGAAKGVSWRRGPNGERLGYAFRLCDRKGENPDEWPLDLRVREMPEGGADDEG